MVIPLARPVPLLLALQLCAAPLVAEGERAGAVVASVEQVGAAAEAGMLPGDLLERWQVRRDDHGLTRGRITSPWSLIALEQEHAGGMTVELSGQREGEATSFTLAPPREWGLVVHPVLPEGARETLRQGVEAIGSGAWQEGTQLLRGLAAAHAVSADRSAWFLYRAGVALEGAGAVQEAGAVLEQALHVAEGEEHADEIHARLARVLLRSGAMEQAVAHAERAVALRSERETAPGLGLARALALLANAQLKLTRLDAAAEELERAHEICARLAPEGMVMTTVLNVLGAVAMRRGQLDPAEKRFDQAWGLLETLDPSSPRAGAVAQNIGAIALARGHLDAAEQWFERALALREANAPDSLEVADTLVALGVVAFRRGQTAAVEQYAGRAVELQRRHAPGSQSEAFGLELLGAASWDRGDLARAERSFQRVLDIRERFAPGSIMSAMCLNNLGGVAHQRGDYAKAEQYHRRALEIRRKEAPGSLEVALSLHNLGTVVWARQDLDAAESYLRQAIAIREDQAPDSVYVAESYANLGGVARDRGRTDEAEQLLTKALKCWQAASPDSLDVALALGNLAAWKIEDGNLDGAVPLITRSLQIREKVAPGSGDNALALQSMGQLAARRGQLEVAEQHFRRALAMFESSGVATTALAETRNLLGCLLRDAGRTEEALDVLSRAIDDLEGVVGRLGGSEEVHSNFRAKHHGMYQDLIDLLVELGRDKQAFHLLERSRARGFLNLLEQRDLLFSLDISEELDRERRLARAELKAQRRKRSGWHVVGFGDPLYPGADVEDGATSLLSAYTRGEPLQPLRWSRDEVSGLRNLFTDTASVWMGADATEERARTTGTDTDVLHFACHALVDERRPLESGLILTVPETPQEGEYDGLLQAWEIIESVRLDADLVVLSACRTALGRELAGEGIVGLTRAFQFAGARSVVASLWAVADRSTSELMLRFYHHLVARSATDEALRLAQLELASGPVRTPGGETLDASHPYFWAAFQLSGDWR